MGIEMRSRNRCGRRKAMSVTQTECVSVAVVIQHSMRMRHVILSSVTCPAVQYFSTLSHKWQDFTKGKVVEKIKTHILCSVIIFFPKVLPFVR